MAILVNDDVVWLKVPEYDVLRVQGLDPEQDLLDVESCLVFSELTFDLKVLGEVTTRAVIRYQEEVICRLERIAQLHNEGVFHRTHYVTLGDCVLLEILLLDFLLGKNLHGKQFLIFSTLNKEHLTE